MLCNSCAMDFSKVFFIFTFYIFAVKSQRLPENVLPTKYTLTIETDLDKLEFKGTVIIALNAISSTNTINLHSKGLIIQKLTLFNGNVNQNARHSFNTEIDLLIVTTTSNFVGSNLRLEIEFSGKLGTENVGYYRAYYLDSNNNNKTMAVTHLEATNARRAFPYFDQPNFKAQFQINLRRKSYQVTSSNMGLINSTQVTGSTDFIDVYEVTPIMSTYLIAFMVSEYGISSVYEDGKLYRTLARLQLLDRGDARYSLNIGPAAIREMEKFTAFNYPIDKMDQVSVSNEYYKIGAMENWGMVTYRERMLMYSNEYSTAAEKQSIATIIVHEFAHQWFGDLVTPEWWKYIWLNEGFATYFEQYATSLIETSWDLMEQFVLVNVQAAFNADGVEGSRPITRNVETTDEIAGIYDTIVYEKAACVIRMAEMFLSTPVFQKGLQVYVNESQYKNVNPSKLYESFQKSLTTPNSINVTEILTPWETQSGYPVLTVTRNYGSNVNMITLRQERFFINKPTGSDSTKWTIPFNYFTENTSTNSIDWLNSASISITVGTLKQNEWIIFNKLQQGFYRVNYDETNWELISDYLESGYLNKIPIENRAQLIDDSFNLARSGRLKYKIPLQLGSFIARETYYVPINTFNNVFSYLDRLFTGDSQHNNLTQYAINILEPLYKNFGFNIRRSDEHLAKLTKNNLNIHLCKYGFKKCLEESGKFFIRWLSGETIQPDMQSYVYCYGMKQSASSLNDVLEKYSNSNEYQEKARIASGLGCAGNSTILNNLLDHLINRDVLFPTDKLNAVNSVFTNNGADGVKIFLEFLRKNYGQINTKIGNTGTIITNLASRITTQEQIDLFNAFATQHSGSMTQTLKNTVSAANVTAHNNLAWVNQYRKEIGEHLPVPLSSVKIFGSFSILITCLFVHLLR